MPLIALSLRTLGNAYHVSSLPCEVVCSVFIVTLLKLNVTYTHTHTHICSLSLGWYVCSDLLQNPLLVPVKQFRASDKVDGLGEKRTSLTGSNDVCVCVCVCVRCAMV